MPNISYARESGNASSDQFARRQWCSLCRLALSAGTMVFGGVRCLKGVESAEFRKQIGASGSCGSSGVYNDAA